MQPKFLTTAVAALLSISSVQAALTAEDLVENIESLTKESADAMERAEEIHDGEVSEASKTGEKLVAGLKSVLVDVVKQTSTLYENDNTRFEEDDQEEVCESFGEFIEAQEDLLKAINGAHKNLITTPYISPVLELLRALEQAEDTLSFGIVPTIPTCVNEIKADFEKLDKNFRETMDKFDKTFKLLG